MEGHTKHLGGARGQHVALSTMHASVLFTYELKLTDIFKRFTLRYNQK